MLYLLLLLDHPALDPYIDFVINFLPACIFVYHFVCHFYERYVKCLISRKSPSRKSSSNSNSYHFSHLKRMVIVFVTVQLLKGVFRIDRPGRSSTQEDCFYINCQQPIGSSFNLSDENKNNMSFNENENQNENISINFNTTQNLNMFKNLNTTENLKRSKSEKYEKVAQNCNSPNNYQNNRKSKNNNSHNKNNKNNN